MNPGVSLLVKMSSGTQEVPVLWSTAFHVSVDLLFHGQKVAAVAPVIAFLFKATAKGRACLPFQQGAESFQERLYPSRLCFLPHCVALVLTFKPYTSELVDFPCLAPPSGSPNQRIKYPLRANIFATLPWNESWIT